MARTDASLVKGVLMDDYGPRRDGTLPDLTAAIDTASAVVDQVQACAAAKGAPQDAGVLALMERWLAAHYYTKSDPVYSSRSTKGASGTFVRDPKEPEPYKAAALDLDFSGCLAAVLERQRAAAVWLGKVPSEQIPVWERD